MEYPVMVKGKPVGNCFVEEQGLYWKLDCRCKLFSDTVERLYCETVRLGVLLRDGDELVLQKRLSKSGFPQFPPTGGIFTVEPVEQLEIWQGELWGHSLSGIRVGNRLLVPYEETKPCPCEALFCFFEIKDGFWQLPLNQDEPIG